MDPSAKSSLRRFGILNAAKKVSEVPVAPKYRANIMSLTYPRILLINVATDIMPAALAILFFPSNTALLYLRILRIIAKKGEEFAKYSNCYIKFFYGDSR